MVERQLPKLHTRVRFPSPAPDSTATAFLNEIAALAPAAACARLRSTPEGLTAAEAAARLRQFGPNRPHDDRPPGLARELWGRLRNPLNALLLTLAVLSFYLGDRRAATVIAAMVVLSVGTAFVQEHRSNRAAARLRAMVHTTASVRRPGAPADSPYTEIPIAALVPGDIVRLSAGDMIPADLRLLAAKDLFVNQAALTGEAMPVEKHAEPGATAPAPLDQPDLCFMGANVVSGFGEGLILRTGGHTFFGQLAEEMAGRRPLTAFEEGVRRFTWLMIRFIAVMVPLVFLINGFGRHDWLEALLFAVAVAVGLTPEMLPMIVTVNLAKGAIAMSRHKVIVKRLNAIQNLGAMDVLCTDKTGTLTQDRIILKRHLDLRGEESAEVLHLAFLNARFQSGLRDLLDKAVLAYAAQHHAEAAEDWKKIDEMPFDFVRRRLSVVLGRPDGTHVLVCKGAVEEMLGVCTRYAIGPEEGALDTARRDAARAATEALNADGFRVIAVARKEIAAKKPAYGRADEEGLTLVGFVAFLDPPKDSARAAIAALRARGVQVKVLTGDNEVITRKICREVDLDVGEILLGSRLDQLDDTALAELADHTTVFAKLNPGQKERVVRALAARGHVVGFLGDGINDSPALKAADVGISVEGAVDIARDSADIILLEKSLLVLQQGVIEGRRVFANILKYIRMGASSNFGNMLSVVGASLFLPFLPMTPIQVLTNNLLYDFSQTAIPTDNVDPAFLEQPRRWDISGLTRFMMLIGPISSVFDYLTFAVMLFVFGAGDRPALFQTGWFTESLLTQTLIIHIIRTARLPFIQSRASAALIGTSLAVCVAGVLLPLGFVGEALGFVPLPPLYWPLLAAMLLGYGVLTHLAKTWYARRFGL